MVRIRSADQLPPEEIIKALELNYQRFEGNERSNYVTKALESLLQGELDPSLFISGWFEGTVVAVLSAEILKDNSALLWSLQVSPNRWCPEWEDQLYGQLHARLATRGVKMAYSFVLPDDSQVESAYLRNRYRKIAAVHNLTLEIRARSSIVPADYRIRNCAEAGRDIFNHLLLESFEGTLDFPELNALRTVEEAIAVFYSGQPDLQRWWIICYQDQPCAILIINDGAEPDHWQLSYLGVRPELRRKGHGRSAMALVLDAAWQAGVTAISLLVDGRNHPAFRLYLGLGFRRNGYRNLYLRDQIQG